MVTSRASSHCLVETLLDFLGWGFLRIPRKRSLRHAGVFSFLPCSVFSWVQWRARIEKPSNLEDLHWFPFSGEGQGWRLRREKKGMRETLTDVYDPGGGRSSLHSPIKWFSVLFGCRENIFHPRCLDFLYLFIFNRTWKLTQLKKTEAFFITRYQENQRWKKWNERNQSFS